MEPVIPTWRVPRVPASWSGGPVDQRSWDRIPRLSPFVLADGSGPAEQPTAVRVCWDETALHVRFDCVDRDAWGTYGWRDDPLYNEEAVEVFLGPGDSHPVNYFEFEVSPKGVVFDARVFNPTSMRGDMRVDKEWDCPDLLWTAGKGEEQDDWWAVLEIPWAGLEQEPGRPTVWRANFYRIEQPRDGTPEYSCWSPTLTSPADFHKPARFGRLVLEP